MPRLRQKSIHKIVVSVFWKCIKSTYSLSQNSEITVGFLRVNIFKIDIRTTSLWLSGFIFLRCRRHYGQFLAKKPPILNCILKFATIRAHRGILEWQRRYGWNYGWSWKNTCGWRKNFDPGFINLVQTCERKSMFVRGFLCSV